MSSLNVLRVAALSLASLLGTTGVRAQNAAAGATSTKFGVINIRQAISSTAEGKQLVTQLQSQFAARQQELESLTKQVDDLQKRLNAGQSTLSEEDKARLSAQGTHLERRLDRKTNEYREDFNTAQEEIVNGIGRKMMELLDRHAQENSYVAVFDSSAQNSPVLYTSKTIDITHDIIRLYDRAYPVKGASTAPPIKPAPIPKLTTPPSPKPR
ncbi:MAG: OmpH family outer membrane protein [Candidatus Acidiferrales bacterium]